MKNTKYLTIYNLFLIIYVNFVLLYTNFSATSQTVLRTNVTMAQGYMDDWRLGKKLSGEVGTVFELNSKFKIDTLNIQ